MTALEARVVHRRPGFTLDVAVEVPGDSTLVVAGESGAGKSTLVRLLAGLEHPEEGRIAFGEEVWYDSAAGIALGPGARRLGWVPQDYALFPHLSAFENVAFGLRASRRPASRVRERTEWLLARVGLAEYGRRRPGELSGGQQQRVALARALAAQPRLLLLDEPLAALDLATRQRVRGELRQLLSELEVVTVFVTHSPLEAMLFGDRIAVLERGRLAQLGSRDELLRRPRSAYVAQFMGLNLLHGRAVERRPDGAVRIRTDDGLVTVAEAEDAEELFIAVSPREITLYRAPPDASAQNLYQGEVVELLPEPPLGERVRVVLDTHPRLVAEVTQRAVERMGLAEGQRVFASFKATGAVAYR